MCHINLSNVFWALRLPEAFLGAFGISDGKGGVSSFRCLPFGRKYSPILCQKVLERLIEETGLIGVLVLIYIDDVLRRPIVPPIVFSKKNSCPAQSLASPLHSQA